MVLWCFLGLVVVDDRLVGGLFSVQLRVVDLVGVVIWGAVVRHLWVR